MKHNSPVQEDSRPEIKIKFIQKINSNGTTLLTAPINIPGVTSCCSSKAYAKSAPVSLHSPRTHHKMMRLNDFYKPVVGGVVGATTLLQSNSVSKQSPNKRVRGESRKCRKVYGMDNRESWCTQCKWKKACSRFTDWPLLPTTPSPQNIFWRLKIDSLFHWNYFEFIFS